MASKRSQMGWSSGGSIQYWDSAKRRDEIARMAEAGAKWLRFDFNWDGVEPTKGSFQFGRYETTVNDCNAAGIKVLGMIGYTPGWARGGVGDNKYPPTNVQDYANACTAIVNHFKNAPYNVKHWEIWNEPNLGCCFWKPKADPVKYTALVRAAYPAIKAADPNAFVLALSSAPAANNTTDMDERDFLMQCYANGLKGFHDGLSHHPYFGPVPILYNADWSAWWKMAHSTLKPHLRQIMSNNGEGHLPMWATETGENADGKVVDGYVADDNNQAQRIREAYDQWSTYPWAGVAFLYNYQDHFAFSVKRSDGSLRPGYYAFKDYQAAPEDTTEPTPEPEPPPPDPGPTVLGKSTIGQLWTASWPPNRKNLTKYPLPEEGEVAELVLYCRGGPVDQPLRLMLYSDASGAADALVATSAEGVVAANAPAAAVALPLPSPIVLAAGDYWLGWITGGSADGIQVAYDDITAPAEKTFGKLTTPSAMQSAAADVKIAGRFQMPEAGSITRMRLYLDGLGEGAGASQILRGILYGDSSALPAARRGMTGEITVVDGQQAGWVEFLFPSAVAFAAGEYLWVGLHGGASNRVARYGYDTVTGAEKFNADTYSDGPSDPFTPSGVTLFTSDKQMAAQMVYTV